MRGVKEDSNFRNAKKSTWRSVGTNDCKALLFQKTDTPLPFVVMCGCKRKEKNYYGKQIIPPRSIFFNKFRTDLCPVVWVSEEY